MRRGLKSPPEGALPEGGLVAAGFRDEGAVGGAEAGEGRAGHAVGLVGGT